MLIIRQENGVNRNAKERLICVNKEGDHYYREVNGGKWEEPRNFASDFILEFV